MPSFRSTRQKGRAPFAPPFLRQIRTLPEKIERDRFPFTLPLFRTGEFELEFTHPVTLFVGENGTGKSTLLEAIARNCGFAALGGSRDNYYARAEEESGLAHALRFAWLPRTSGFFFRAECFFGFIDYVERAYREDGKLPPWGERSLHHLSHGEAFLLFFQSRLGAQARCVYLLDEPEAALAPDRQLEFLAMIAEQRASGNVQYVIATHSPLLMACPDADIVLFTHRGIRRTGFRETPHFRRYRDFFDDPEGYVRREIVRIAEERREALETDRETTERKGGGDEL